MAARSSAATRPGTSATGRPWPGFRPLRGLIAACLAKRPADRPSLPELTDALSVHWTLSGAGPPGEFWPETLTRLVRSHGAAIAAQAGTAPVAERGAPQHGAAFAAQTGTAPEAERGGPKPVANQQPLDATDGAGYGAQRNVPATTVAAGAEPGPRSDRPAAGQRTVTSPRVFAPPP